MSARAEQINEMERTPIVPFTGIPFAALDFYEDLEADNSKVFWTAHKHIYDEQVRLPLQELALELAEEFGPAKFFRPYRDVRFAKDKTPYKNHQGVYFSESRRYLQISAAGMYVSGGIYEMASDQVARYRRSVAEDLSGHALQASIATADPGQAGRRRRAADPGAARLRQGTPAPGSAAAQVHVRQPRVRLPGLVADHPGQGGDPQGLAGHAAVDRLVGQVRRRLRPADRAPGHLSARLPGFA